MKIPKLALLANKTKKAQEIAPSVIPLGSGYVGAGCAGVEFQEIRLSE